MDETNDEVKSKTPDVISDPQTEEKVQNPMPGADLGQGDKDPEPVSLAGSDPDMEIITRTQYDEMVYEKLVKSTSEQNEKGEFIVELTNGKSYWVKK